MAGLVEAINNSASLSRTSPIPSPHFRSSSNLASLSESPTTFMFPNASASNGRDLPGSGARPIRKQNSTSSLGAALDGASATGGGGGGGGHASLKIAPGDGRQQQHHQHQSVNMRKMSTGSIDEQV